MSGTNERHAKGTRDLDPLRLSVAGTVLAAVGAVAWPELRTAVLCLLLLASLIVWVRTLDAVRTRRMTGYRLRWLAPLGATGLAGWSGIAAVGAFAPSGTIWAMMVVAASLWPASHIAGLHR